MNTQEPRAARLIAVGADGPAGIARQQRFGPIGCSINSVRRTFFQICEWSEHQRNATGDDGVGGRARIAHAFEDEVQFQFLGKTQRVGDVIFAIGFEPEGNLAAHDFAEEILGRVVLEPRAGRTGFSRGSFLFAALFARCCFGRFGGFRLLGFRPIVVIFLGGFERSLQLLVLRITGERIAGGHGGRGLSGVNLLAASATAAPTATASRGFGSNRRRRRRSE
jgi:hypothetical protein